MKRCFCSCHSHDGFLTRRGYEALAQPEVDKAEVQLYLDKVGSVSALVEVEDAYVWDETLIEEQHRRFLHA